MHSNMPMYLRSRSRPRQERRRSATPTKRRLRAGTIGRTSGARSARVSSSSFSSQVLTDTGRPKSTPRPRYITPSNTESRSFFSWDEPQTPLREEEVPPEVVLGRTSEPRFSDRSVVSDIGFLHPVTDLLPSDEDLPMDEALDRYQPTPQRSSVYSAGTSSGDVGVPQKPMTVLTTQHPAPSFDQPPVGAVDSADRGGGIGAASWISATAIEADELSPLGGMEDQFSALERLTLAMQQDETLDPSQLASSEEKALWEALQAKIEAVQNESTSQRRQLERQIQSSTAELDQVLLREKKLEIDLDKSKRELAALKEANKKKTEVSPTSVARSTHARMLKRSEEKLAKLEKLHQDQQAAAAILEKEHEQSIRAMQRVLADVSHERDVIADALKEQLDKQKAREQEEDEEKRSMVSAFERELESHKTKLQRAEKDRFRLKHSLEQKERKIVTVERELTVTKASLSQAKTTLEPSVQSEELAMRVQELEEELEKSKTEVASLSSRKTLLTADLNAKEKQIWKLKRQLRGYGSAADNGDDSPNDSDEVALLRRQLKDKDASLENAKKIILSLESANGSLAADLRRKLREKEEKIFTLEAENSDRKRTLDSLATELRDLKQQMDGLDEREKVVRKQKANQKLLSNQLVSAVDELQSAAVVHEIMAENGAADVATLKKVSEVIGSTLTALKAAAVDDDSDQCSDALTDIGTDVGSITSDLNRTLDAIIQNDRESAAKELREQLDEKVETIKILERSLREKAEDTEKLRHDMEQLKSYREAEESQLRDEIQMLRDQCKTNLENLTKKEHELNVLRDSLQDNEGVGYISGDETDGEDQEALPISSGFVANNHNIFEEKLRQIRLELIKAQSDSEQKSKDLETEKQNLSNAKMIISSLERANKHMLEDLKHRLQDSNTAISSLLDKSSEHEKTAEALRSELKKVKAEKQKEVNDLQAELSRLKEQNLASALKLASDTREILENTSHDDSIVSIEQPIEEKKDEEINVVSISEGNGENSD